MIDKMAGYTLYGEIPLADWQEVLIALVSISTVFHTRIMHYENRVSESGMLEFAVGFEGKSQDVDGLVDYLVKNSHNPQESTAMHKLVQDRCERDGQGESSIEEVSGRERQGDDASRKE